MDTLVMIVQFMLSLSILIVLHELGHFLPAKWFKTKVEKFYLFFDPWFSLWKIKKGDTEYGIGWLPLGGYVKISGMIDESFDKEQMAGPPQPWEFRSKPAWQRLIIMLGGVTVNFILGIIVFGFVLFNWGEEFIPTSEVKEGIYADSLGLEFGLVDGDKIKFIGDVPFDKFSHNAFVREVVINSPESIKVERNGTLVDIPVDRKFAGILSSQKNKDMRLFGPRNKFVVGEVTKDSPAEKAGIQVSDQVIGLNGAFTPYYHEFVRVLRSIENRNAEVILVRNNRDTLSLSLKLTENNMLGVNMESPFATEHQKYSLAQALPAGYTKSYRFISDQIKAFGKMFSGEIKAKESLGSVISIGKMYGTTWQWDRFWNLTAMLSILLGFLNLLPIPALDGGHVVFLLFEVITGIKPSDKVIEYATLAGFILLVILMIFAFGLDISRLF
jgi:regulator of sigma E protease